MAHKTAQAAIQTMPSDQIANFRVNGVMYSDADKGGDGTLILSLPVVRLEIDWSEMRDVLLAGKVDERRVDDYMEKLGRIIECDEMARALAERLQRLD